MYVCIYELNDESDITGHMLIFDRVKLKSQYQKTGLVIVKLHIQWNKRRKEALSLYIYIKPP